MDLDYCLNQMAADAQRIRALAEGVDDRQARWKPDSESWSILEVICHLLDEEKKDFRVRLDITLHRPQETWPGIDPAGWVTEFNYNEQDLAASLQAFLEERAASLTWLRGLDSSTSSPPPEPARPELAERVEGELVKPVPELARPELAERVEPVPEPVEGELTKAWDAMYEAPWGPMRAGDLLASWVAHDLLHMRQLVELHWLYKEEQVEPYSTRYAGEW